MHIDAIKTGQNEISDNISLSTFTHLYVFSIIPFLAILAFAAFFTAWGLPDGLAGEKDAVLGLTAGTMLIIWAMLYLALAAYLWVTQDLSMQALAIFWLGLNHVVYGAGMYWCKANVPFPIVKLLGQQFGISPSTANFCWELLVAYLFIPSLACLFIEWRRFKQGRAEAFLRGWRKARKNQERVSLARPIIRPPSSPKTQNPSTHESASPRSVDAQHDISSRTDIKMKEVKAKPVPHEFTFSCPNCGQHIKCDEGYVNRQINCPSCGKQIAAIPGA
jgi:hypothetical protein